MLIDELVQFCHTELQTKPCRGCTKTGNGDCGHNCKNCLDDLHYHQNCIRCDYTCERLLDHYVCRYSYKYCSEILYALETVDLSRYPVFNILSLGCGGATDLMAFDYLSLPQPLAYLGLDKNPYWARIHAQIAGYFSAGGVPARVQFSQDTDVLRYFDNTSVTNCNILIVEYLLSFFYAQIGRVGTIQWFRALVRNVVAQKMPSSPFLVIFNDVDSRNTGRDTFPAFRSIVEEAGLHVNFERRMCFKPDSYYADAQHYPSRRNQFQLPSFVKDNYTPAINCESAQLILEVQ